MNVPFIDLNLQFQKIERQYFKKLKEIFLKGSFILGEEVEQFETEFAKYCGSSFAVGVNSGTDALFLSLLSLGIGRGDKVIVPALTYIATALAVSYTQAEPVFVDVDPRYYTIDIEKVKKRLDHKVKAVIPVHLYGHPADMASLLKLKQKYGFKIVQDCAQAHGAKWKNNKNYWQVVGSGPDISAFSFYPTKNLGAAGDAGIILTNNKNIYRRLKRLRDYGRIDRYRHTFIGYNSRLDTVQAALLNLKLKELDKFNEMRRKAAKIYSKLLSGTSGVILPQTADYAQDVFHIYAVQFNDRNRILSFFKNNNISALIHYPIPLHLQRAYQNLGYRKGDFPVSEGVTKRLISLPIYPFIRKKQIEYVVLNIKKALK